LRGQNGSVEMKLEDIEKLCENIAKGPWHVSYGDGYAEGIFCSKMNCDHEWDIGSILKVPNDISDSYYCFSSQISTNNAKFIAASRDFVPWAIKRIRRLEKIEECMRHAVALKYFNPGGSTEGWAKEALEELENDE
jgi:hypothetical protein